MILMMSLAMAKHGKRRGSSRYSLRRVNTTAGITLGALANQIVVTGALTGSADGAYRIISVSGVWSLKNAFAGEGPVTVGFAHSDYSVTEIKEALESGASISIGLKVEQERTRRLVRVVGQFAGPTIDAQDQTLNDGKPIKTRLNWFIPIGKAVNLFAYNDSGAVLQTNGIVDFTGPLWVKDNF